MKAALACSLSPVVVQAITLSSFPSCDRTAIAPSHGYQPSVCVFHGVGVCSVMLRSLGFLRILIIVQLAAAVAMRTFIGPVSLANAKIAATMAIQFAGVMTGFAPKSAHVLSSGQRLRRG